MICSQNYAITNISHHARLTENEDLFRYRAYRKGNLLPYVCARSHVRALYDAKIVRSRDAQCNAKET